MSSSAASSGAEAVRSRDVMPIKKKSGPRTPWFIAFYRTSVGMKWAMALSGIVLMGYVFAHMVGNLKMYFGEETFNHYAEFLRDMGEPIFPRTVVLWLLRSVIIVALVVHIHAAYSLTVQNRKARKVKYQSQRDYIAASFASRTMRWGGVIILLFIIWHLADLTWGWANPDFVRGEAYDNLAASLTRLPVTTLYIVANIALGFHLFHGVWSMFQSLGLNNPRYNQAKLWFARGFAILVAAGNISFPLAVTFGIVG